MQLSLEAVVTIWSPKWGLAGRGEPETLDNKSAPGGTRTPNLLIRRHALVFFEILLIGDFCAKSVIVKGFWGGLYDSG